MIVAIVLILYLLVAGLDFRLVVKKANKKECLVYLVILAISFTILILYGLDIRVPGPTDLIVNVIRTLFGV